MMIVKGRRYTGDLNAAKDQDELGSQLSLSF